MKLRAAVAMIVLSGVVPVAAQQKVPLVLHHLMITIDSATYRDVVNSPFIRDQFSAVDESFSGDFPHLSGLRILGKYNYLGLTSPQVRHGAAVGDIDVVLSVETAGGLGILARDPMLRGPLARAVVGFSDMESSRYLGDGAHYLRIARPDSLSSHSVFEIMQYDGRAAKALSRVDSLPETNLSNARFLARYFNPKRLFVYLTGATLAIPVDDITKISRVLQRDGIPVFPEGEGAIIKLDGFTLHLIPSYVGAGVKQLQFALTRTAVGNPIYRFGPKSQLQFGPGPIAVWDFTSQ